MIPTDYSKKWRSLCCAIFTSRPLATVWSLDPLDNDRNTLADADAHGAQRIAALGAFQLIDRGRHQPCAGRAERVADRDGTTVRVDMGGIVG